MRVGDWLQRREVGLCDDHDCPKIAPSITVFGIGHQHGYYLYLGLLLLEGMRSNCHDTISVCARLTRKPQGQTSPNFCTCRLWPWFGPSQEVLRYAVNFQTPSFVEDDNGASCVFRSGDRTRTISMHYSWFILPDMTQLNRRVTSRLAVWTG